MIEDLYRLTLVDGLPVDSQGKTLRYRIVHLREVSVADERIAQRMAERVVFVEGAPKLLVSDADFRYALNMRHIEAFECDGMKIHQPMIDLDLVGKLSSHDMGLIEARIFLVTLAAEVRYGNLSQAEFDAVAAGKAPGQVAGPATPQPEGQAATVGAAAAHSQPGPALLADFAGADAGGQAQSDGA